MTGQTTDRGEFSNGWKVLFAGVIGVACGASPLPFNIIGFTIEPLTAEFGWSRLEIFLPLTFFGIIASFLAPVFGWMADRYGVRKVALYSMAAFGLTLAAIGLTPRENLPSTLYIYYGFWVAMGLVSIGSTPVTFSRAINLWFFKNRGLALGILLLGSSLSALIIPQMAVWSIDNYGWRGMFVIIAALPLLLALPIGVFLFREPLVAERPAGITANNGALTGVTLGDALKDYRFWLIWLSIAGISGAAGGAFANLPAMLGDQGLPASVAATVMGFVGIGLLSGRLITGALLDRIWAGLVAFPLLCLPAISCYLLLGDGIDFAVATIAGFLLGFALGSEADLIAFLAGRYFGMANYGKIYGMLYVPFGLFAAISPIVYAMVYDNTQSYDAILFPAIFVFVIAGGLLLLLGPYPDSFDKQADPPPTAHEGRS